MVDDAQPTPTPPVRFGRTEVSAIEGDLLTQEVDAIVLPANARGVLGAVAITGVTGLRTLAGSEIERDAMAKAPLELGTAVVTNPGRLRDRGVRHVIHAVMRRDLASSAKPNDIRRALAASLIAADRERDSSVAIAAVTSGHAPSAAEPDALLRLTAEEIVSVLRRSNLRLLTVIIVCRFADQAATMAELLQELRNRAWE